MVDQLWDPRGALQRRGRSENPRELLRGVSAPPVWFYGQSHGRCKLSEKSPRSTRRPIEILSFSTCSLGARNLRGHCRVVETVVRTSREVVGQARRCGTRWTVVPGQVGHAGTRWN